MSITAISTREKTDREFPSLRSNLHRVLAVRASILDRMRKARDIA